MTTGYAQRHRVDHWMHSPFAESSEEHWIWTTPLNTQTVHVHVKILGMTRPLNVRRRKVGQEVLS